MIRQLKDDLKEPLEEIEAHEEAIAGLIPEERRLRNKSKIVNGERELPPKQMAEFNGYGKQIRRHDATPWNK